MSHNLQLKSGGKVIKISTDKPVIKSAEITNAAGNDEYSDLPLTDFEKSIQQLQRGENGDYEYSSIIQRLEDKYTEERDAIYQSGYKAGFEAGQAENEQKYQGDLKAFEHLIRDIKESRWRLRKEAELSMLSLVVQIAERVTASSFAMDESKVLKVIQEAMHLTNENEIIKITLNADDYKYVMEKSDLLNEIPESIDLAKDRAISRGGCIISTNMETIDARIETKLNQLTEELYMNMNDQED